MPRAWLQSPSGFASRMSASATLCLVLAGAGVLSLPPERTSGTLAIVAGVFGATIAGLGLTVLAGYHARTHSPG